MRQAKEQQKAKASNSSASCITCFTAAPHGSMTCATCKIYSSPPSIAANASLQLSSRPCMPPLPSGIALAFTGPPKPPTPAAAPSTTNSPSMRGLLCIRMSFRRSPDLFYATRSPAARRARKSRGLSSCSALTRKRRAPDLCSVLYMVCRARPAKGFVFSDPSRSGSSCLTRPHKA